MIRARCRSEAPPRGDSLLLALVQWYTIYETSHIKTYICSFPISQSREIRAYELQAVLPGFSLRPGIVLSAWVSLWLMLSYTFPNMYMHIAG